MNYKDKKIQELEQREKNKELSKVIEEYHKINKEIDRDWGSNRILNLISKELRIRYMRALDKFRFESYKYDKAKLYSMMIRAKQSLIDEAINNGHSKLEDEFIYLETKKGKFVICKTKDQLTKAYLKYAQKENIIVLSLEEITLLIDNNFEHIKKVFHKFGATIKKYENKRIT